ncbi:hypothetical protein CYMTET_8740 [Cymbomonas tetramitiformis]|uniref:Uncharacterized protein n=1 Tax=Cymbomonas tetramitiformis TaxID=36881 RepID=A0AAE0GSP6_9CHLO|nr:hypothetical protein CYMTET_8740 [Cymbomonas tetramitiformis]
MRSGMRPKSTFVLIFLLCLELLPRSITAATVTPDEAKKQKLQSAMTSFFSALRPPANVSDEFLECNNANGTQSLVVSNDSPPNTLASRPRAACTLKRKRGRPVGWRKHPSVKVKAKKQCAAWPTRPRSKRNAARTWLKGLLQNGCLPSFVDFSLIGLPT